MRFDLSSAPAIEPCTEADLVSHCQIGELPDDQIARARVMLAAARQWVENRLHRQLITATWKYYLDEFPVEIQIPDKLPVATIATLKYYDTANVLQTVAASLYDTDLASDSRPPRIRPASGQSWPLTYDRYNAVEVTFTAGYGATRESVPLGIRHAILILAADWFANREDVVIGAISSRIETGVEMCLQPFDWGFYA
jgi:uncharacterized phiE125 gp8 family phage protein